MDNKLHSGMTGREAPFADGDDRFNARDIVILQDNDAPGAKKALAAAQALYGYAKSVRIVLLPGLPAGGGDLTDWLEDTAALPRHDRDLLIKLACKLHLGRQIRPPKMLRTLPTTLLTTRRAAPASRVRHGMVLDQA